MGLPFVVVDWVRVAFEVKDGVPINVGVVEANPRGPFDRSAVTAVSQWRFQNEVSGGRYAVLIRYELDM